MQSTILSSYRKGILLLGLSSCGLALQIVSLRAAAMCAIAVAKRESIPPIAARAGSMQLAAAAIGIVSLIIGYAWHVDRLRLAWGGIIFINLVLLLMLV